MPLDARIRYFGECPFESRISYRGSGTKSYSQGQRQVLQSSSLFDIKVITSFYNFCLLDFQGNLQSWLFGQSVYPV